MSVKGRVNMDELIKKYKKHISSLFAIECNDFDVRLKEFTDKNNIYCSRCTKQCDFNTTHLYGCYESVRWDNKYIYYCPAGFVFIAVPVFDELSILNTGIVCGPLLMGTREDFKEVIDVPFFETGRVNDLTEIISAVFVPKFAVRDIQENKEDFLNCIYKELEILPKHKNYPIELEKKLQTAILDRDKKRSKELLNKLLGYIFFYSNADLKLIKARVLELIVMLSRSAIDGGADVEQIFALNNNYIREVESFSTLEKLSVWLTGVINRFVSYVFEFNDVKHIDIIHKITAYIKDNYMHKITLNDVAEHVYLSKSYVSKIFKKEMNVTLTEYINNIRIEKSRVLLLDSSLSLADVANLVGFEDQSYYNKIFKSKVGVSPGKYREKSGKI